MMDDGRAEVVSRRDLLRWITAAGAASVLPVGLGACLPGKTPMPLAPDAFLRGRGFTGGIETDLGAGAWCWFQSPRASFGPGGILWLGSSVAGTQTADDGAVQATAFDTTTSNIVLRRTLTITRQDDHTSPSVLALGNEAQISWALHKPLDYLDISTATAGGAYRTQRIRRPGSMKRPGRGMSYSSAHVVGGNRWILYRGEQFSWNLLTSPDGATWTAHGLVVAPGTAGDRPYVHATSDGTRLHVVVSDGNPTEFRGTSAWAGTIDADLTIRRADGKSIGRVGSTAPPPQRFTRLAAGTRGASEALDTDLWLSDLQFVDRRPTGILSVRDPWPAGASAVDAYRHRYLWIRQRPTGWLVEPLCWAGGELCPTQPDYAGLGAQDPTEPKRVVVSTNVHPVTAEPLVSAADGLIHFELFEGYRVAEGQWTWTALTADSIEDNVRPVIAAGGSAKALAWMRGRYWAWTDAHTRIVVRTAAAVA